MQKIFSLGDRMKEYYENVSRVSLSRKTPVIIRLDGKAFHTFTRHMKKPYDMSLIELMNYTAIEVLNEIQGAKCAYVQSDEISILITDFDTIHTESWFDYNVQKMVSISSAIASVAFSKKFLEKSLLDDNLENLSSKTVLGSNAYFDARAFNMPKEEIANYFIWRQKDWERNSIQMLARSMYSQKELTGKKIPEIHDMIHDKGDNWANLPDALKNGRLIERVDGKFQVLDVCGIFTQNRSILEKHLVPIED